MGNEVGPEWSDWRERIVELLDDYEDTMTEMEVNFLCDMQRRLEQYMERAFMSERQMNWIEKIEKKYDVQ